jgi:chemotaxis protein MotB
VSRYIESCRAKVHARPEPYIFVRPEHGNVLIFARTAAILQWQGNCLDTNVLTASVSLNRAGGPMVTQVGRWSGSALIVATVLATGLLTGCVSQELHTRTVSELEKAKKRTTAELEALKTATAAEIESLRNDNTRLTNELAAASGRVTSLSNQLIERDADLATLRTLRDEQAAKLTATAGELDQTKRRLDDLTSQLATLNQEREGSAAQIRKQEDSLREALQAVERMRLDQQNLQGLLAQEQSNKESEIERLTKTQAALAKSLEAEIAKGEIRIQQVQDRLTINMVDKVLFDSGQGHVKPAGLKVLKQVSNILRTVKDKQIRIEGHTDNVRIGGKLKERFPTNWELSTTRATSVVRYLLDEGGIDPANISAVGYSDTRPIASNDTDEGRTANRRIEIVLYPKDLKEILKQVSSKTN